LVRQPFDSEPPQEVGWLTDTDSILLSIFKNQGRRPKEPLMKHVALLLGLVAVAVPAHSASPVEARAEQTEQAPAKRKFHPSQVRNGDQDAVIKTIAWLVGTVGVQLAAHKAGAITIPGANVATVGTALHMLGDFYESDRLEDWGKNFWYLAGSHELLTKFTYGAELMDEGWKKANPALGEDYGEKNKLTDEVAKAEIKAHNDSILALGTTMKTVIVAALMKLFVEKAPDLWAAQQACVSQTAKVPVK
jgi:hypothetical protein